jgi:hypothetical protein
MPIVQSIGCGGSQRCWTCVVITLPRVTMRQLFLLAQQPVRTALIHWLHNVLRRPSAVPVDSVLNPHTVAYEAPPGSPHADHRPCRVPTLHGARTLMPNTLPARALRVPARHASSIHSSCCWRCVIGVNCPCPNRTSPGRLFNTINAAASANAFSLRFSSRSKRLCSFFIVCFSALSFSSRSLP